MEAIIFLVIFALVIWLAYWLIDSSGAKQFGHGVVVAKQSTEAHWQLMNVAQGDGKGTALQWIYFPGSYVLRIHIAHTTASKLVSGEVYESVEEGDSISVEYSQGRLSKDKVYIKKVGEYTQVGRGFLTRLLLFTGFIGCLWLCVPFLIQAIIDKVLVQQNSSILQLIGIILAVAILLAGTFELILASMIANASRHKLTSKSIISTFVSLPRIFLSLCAFSLYNLTFTIVVVALSSIFNVAIYLFYRQRSYRAIAAQRAIREDRLCLYIPIGMTIPMVFWYGCTFVLKNELTLGELMSFTIIEAQFMISALNIVTSGTQTKITP